jgi:hypothetical protein
MSADFEVMGDTAAAPFTLKAHRGEGMVLLAMDWKAPPPPADFVGFAIEYSEPGGGKFFPVNNRLGFPRADGGAEATSLETTLSPIQKFRWVHFPRNAELAGDFVYKVSPVFMDGQGELSAGTAQEVALELRRETYPGQLNVAFTRGFVSSQAFVDRYEPDGPISTLLPADADEGLRFKPTHPKSAEALQWMGFEARSAILEVLDQAIADTAAKVCVVAYDLDEPGVVSRLEQLGSRLRVIIDDDGAHGEDVSAEHQAEARLVASAGRANVKRQHMGHLQHNKTIVVDGPQGKTVVCGSTNFSWRGFFVQANNAVVLHGDAAVAPFAVAFEGYWNNDGAAGFAATPASKLTDLGLTGIDAGVAFSPHSSDDALLARIAADIADGTTSSLLYSLAFLSMTPGPILDAIKTVTAKDDIFVYGISDKKVGGIDLQTPAGNVVPVFAAALGKNVPEPFKSEPAGGSGARMHHKFVVIDFDKPTARVYFGSYNFSDSADLQNGENLLLVKDRRIATSYAVEALRIFDHYHFRVAQKAAGASRAPLVLATPPRDPSQKPWWERYYTDPQKVRDREMFA